jgi:SpoVK/Ycf46/Vps4 family AAA+-type ATPase
MLQEVEDWPDTGLLLAATNHPELIDPALWRRFDLIVQFDLPDIPTIREAMKRFLGTAYESFKFWEDILAYCFAGESYSYIEKTIQRFRRNLALGFSSEHTLVEEFIEERSVQLPQKQRIELAVLLSEKTRLSQHAISSISGVSRDTIRKYGGKTTKGAA